MTEKLLWQTELSNSIKTIDELKKLNSYSAEDLNTIKKIHSEFAFSITRYYASLINWKDPNDPLMKIVSPDIREINPEGNLHVGEEYSNTVSKGIQIKYPTTALLIPFPACFSYCRFCFRKRLFLPEYKGQEVLKDLDNAVEVIKSNPTVNNILVSGGDPLMMKTKFIRKFLELVFALPQIRFVRFGTKALSFLPHRFYSDPELLDLFDEFSKKGKTIYIINHISHPNEISDCTIRAVKSLHKANVILCNQTPILKDVNDKNGVINKLLNEMTSLGIAPYYLFQFKFIEGGKHFKLSLREVIDIYNRETRNLNGIAKRVKLIMAHATGKIELLGYETLSTSDIKLHYKYHQSKNPDLIGKLNSINIKHNQQWLNFN